MTSDRQCDWVSTLQGGDIVYLTEDYGLISPLPPGPPMPNLTNPEEVAKWLDA